MLEEGDGHTPGPGSTFEDVKVPSPLIAWSRPFCCTLCQAHGCTAMDRMTCVILSLAQEYYGKVLSTSADLKTNACTAAGRPHRLIRDIMQRIPAAVSDKFYGCGAPLPLGIKGVWPAALTPTRRR